MRRSTKLECTHEETELLARFLVCEAKHTEHALLQSPVVNPDRAATELDAETIVRRSLDIAADICVYTNRNVTIETLKTA